MTDRRAYSFSTTDLDRGSQWSTGSQHPPRYLASSSTYQAVQANSTYPTMPDTTHNMASVHPPVQYGVNDYAGDYPPSVSSQYMVATPNTYHQSRQSYPPTNQAHQAQSPVPHYTVPSHQYPAPQQPSIHHTSPYYGRGDSHYPQPQYPASPSRPFSCDLCALSFNRQHDLKRHRETHSGEKPFLCNGGCGKTFTRKDALKRHQACLLSRHRINALLTVFQLVKHCGHESEAS